MLGDQIKEVWETRQEEIVNRWYIALIEIGLTSSEHTPQEMLQTLRKVLSTLFTLLLSPPPLDREQSRAAGYSLTLFHRYNPQTLRISLETLYIELMHSLSPDAHLSLVPHLASLLAEFAAGYQDGANNALLQEQIKIRQAIENECEKTEEELKSAYRAASLLLYPHDLITMTQHVAKAVVKELKQVDCGVLLLDPETGELDRVARAGRYIVEAHTQLCVDGPGLVPKAIRLDRPLYVQDVTQDDDYVISDPRTRSEFVVPLRVGNQIIGVLDLQSEEVAAFSLRDRRIVIAFAERAATAINNAQLREVLRQEAAKLEERVSERTAQLRRTMEQVEAIINESSDAIILLHLHGAIRLANPAFSHQFGYDQEEALELSIQGVVDPATTENLSHLLHQVASNKRSARMETMARRKDGSVFAADIALSALSDIDYDDAPASVIICSVRDVSERKKLEQELRKNLERERELNELKLQFSALMSHEFRTPLTAISTASEMLQKYYDRMTEERKLICYTQIKDQVSHLTHLLDDILALSKAQMIGLKFQPIMIELVELCQAVINDAESAYPSAAERIKFSTSRPDITLYGDDKLLRLGILNLLTNALKYSADHHPVTFSLNTISDAAIITIQDHGIGIPENEHQYLFRDFYRAHNVGEIPGTGLGLVLVKQVVDQHGGTIWFESAANAGTTFYIHLPYAHENNT